MVKYSIQKNSKYNKTYTSLPIWKIFNFVGGSKIRQINRKIRILKINLVSLFWQHFHRTIMLMLKFTWKTEGPEGSTELKFKLKKIEKETFPPIDLMTAPYLVSPTLRFCWYVFYSADPSQTTAVSLHVISLHSILIYHSSYHSVSHNCTEICIYFFISFTGLWSDYVVHLCTSRVPHGA